MSSNKEQKSPSPSKILQTKKSPSSKQRPRNHKELEEEDFDSSESSNGNERNGPNILKKKIVKEINKVEKQSKSSKETSSKRISPKKPESKNSPRKNQKEAACQGMEEETFASQQIQKSIQLNSDQSLVLQRQTDKIYEDFSNIVDIFGEAVSYQKSQFDPEFLQNVQEKLEMKIDNSGFLYQALSKEAAKDKTHSQILTENLVDKKKEVLKMFTQLKPMLANFNLTEQVIDFESVLKDQPITQRVYPPISFENISQEKLAEISEALNQLLGKFFQIKEAGEKVVHNAQREKMLVSDVDGKINEFSKKTNFLPANDIQYIINDLCNCPNPTNQKYLEKMIDERLINPEEVDTYHNQLGKVKRPDIVLTVEKLQQYKENFLL